MPAAEFYEFASPVQPPATNRILRTPTQCKYLHSFLIKQQILDVKGLHRIHCKSSLPLLLNFAYSPNLWWRPDGNFNPRSPLDKALISGEFWWQPNQSVPEPAFYAFGELTLWHWPCMYFQDVQVQASKWQWVRSLLRIFRTALSVFGSTYPIPGMPAVVSTMEASFIGTGVLQVWIHLILFRTPYILLIQVRKAVTLIIASDIGCTNSVTKTVHVYPLPIANFSFDPQFEIRHWMFSLQISPPVDQAINGISRRKFPVIFMNLHIYQDTEFSLFVNM